MKDRDNGFGAGVALGAIIFGTLGFLLGGAAFDAVTRPSMEAAELRCEVEALRGRLRAEVLADEAGPIRDTIRLIPIENGGE